jgi:Lon protease-like protein
MGCSGLARAMVAVVLLCMPWSVWAQAEPPVPVRGADSLPEVIPLFPLDDIFVFPNILLPLNIFEPRYRAMVADALKGDRVIGMVQLRPGYEPNYEGRPPVFAIGCAGVITQVDQLPDGRYTILLRGLVKFRILSEDQSRPYRLARVEPIPEEPDDRERAALAKQRERLLALLPAGSEPPPRDVSDEDLINALAQYSRIGALQRQELLELNGPLLRSEALIKLLENK